MLKATAADYLHFVLLTGVSKYGKISLFSDLNNLLDITMDRRFATLLGYTQAELEQYFPERIDQVAQTYNMSRPEMLALIAHWYNGYSWDGVNKVYVPFSTLVFLEQHYRNQGKPIILLGIAFDQSNRNIAEWQMEQLP